MSDTRAIRKQLVAAIIMVLVAAVALGSATYAWFVSNGTVTATVMQVKAQAESGIVIKADGVSGAKFATSADAKMTTGTALKPTSTVDLTNWYHAASDEKDDAKAQQTTTDAYTKLTSTDEYMLMKTFYIRSASEDVALTKKKLAVSSVEATSTTTSSESLDKSVRIGIKISNHSACTDTLYIYAPMADSNFELVAKYTSPETKLTEKTEASSTSDVFALDSNTIAASDTAIKADVYMFFEGEDSNCKSSNITETMDNLNVTVKFEAQDVTTS